MPIVQPVVAVVASAEERRRIEEILGSAFHVVPFERGAGSMILEYPWDIGIFADDEPSAVKWRARPEAEQRAIVTTAATFDDDELLAHVHAAEREVAAKRVLSLEHHAGKLAASIDELTGLYNRRHFDELLPVRFDHAREHNTPLSLILFDIDGFRSVTSMFGRRRSDQVLLAMSDLIAAEVRTDDLAARYDFDLFAFLTARDRAQAIVVAEEVRHIAEVTTLRAGSSKIRCTVSAGVVSLPAAEFPFADAFRFAAEAAVGQAKELGRNRVFAH
jgi:diguanylate cyclase (GGDEF)-like protein